MNKTIRTIIYYFGLMLVLAGISYTAYYFDHPIIALVLLVVPIGMIANGFLAEAEDNAPGGFNNPSSDATDIDAKNLDKKA
ncbi:MAG: hypothetical protein PHR77_15240 [Kiritimatiellae bacterium]|nr:hypothetical protein [Kiritimatiellia bacterium]MDD5523444.1 hypothetical protein [Kiritimatiellia bacterium]